MKLKENTNYQNNLSYYTIWLAPTKQKKAQRILFKKRGNCDLELFRSYQVVGLQNIMSKVVKKLIFQEVF